MPTSAQTATDWPDSRSKGRLNRLVLFSTRSEREGCHHRRMKVRPPPSPPAPPRTGFDLAAFLASLGLANTPILYKRGETIFKQGGPGTHVMFLQTGGVKVSVLSKSGREAVVGLFGPGDFFGEGCLAGQLLHHGSAIAILPSAVLSIPKNQMAALLRKQHTMANQFIAHMLARNSRIESDLLDQLFNSTEKRLARALLLLAGYGTDQPPATFVPKISQATLGEMIGATRPRVNFFLNKFKKLGFITYDGVLPPTIDRSLLTVLLHDDNDVRANRAPKDDRTK
jgi:CRP/FNR family cyclic AMP-dependent transcriptional regulator